LASKGKEKGGLSLTLVHAKKDAQGKISQIERKRGKNVPPLKGKTILGTKRTGKRTFLGRKEKRGGKEA